MVTLIFGKRFLVRTHFLVRDFRSSRMPRFVSQQLKLEQKYAICYLVRQEKSFQDCFDALKRVYKEDVLSYSTLYRVFLRARAGVGVNRFPGSGRKSTINTHSEAINNLIQEDRKISIRQIANQLDIPKSSVSLVIKKILKYRKSSATWVPHKLTDSHKEQRKDVCETLLERYEEEGEEFLNRIVTMDETYVYFYDPVTRREARQWKHRGSPRVMVCNERSKHKLMMLSFFDANGPILNTFLKRNETMTAKLFVSVVKRRLLRRLKIKRPHLFTENGACRMILHMDNARPHSAHLTRIQLQMQGIETLPHSPDIAPCDFWLFGILKSSLRGRIF